MSRLIDADELIKRLNEKALAQHDIPLVEHDSRELIHDAPTVDAVEVVRCKDCKWYRGCYMLEYDDGYCSDGERKDDEHK